MHSDSDLHETRTDGEHSETQADFRVSFVSRKKLAPPSHEPFELDRLYDHVDGPYKATFKRSEGCWHVWWDGWCEEPLLRFDSEAEAVFNMRHYAAQWRETAGRKVYFIGPANRIGGRVKIGIAFDPRKRLNNLQTGSHEPLQILATYRGDKPEEARLHRKFSRVRLGGEWFRITPRLKRLIEECSVPTRERNIG
jgi:hypothetical protein